MIEKKFKLQYWIGNDQDDFSREERHILEESALQQINDSYLRGESKGKLKLNLKQGDLKQVLGFFKITK